MLYSWGATGVKIHLITNHTLKLLDALQANWKQPGVKYWRRQIILYKVIKGFLLRNAENEAKDLTLSLTLLIRNQATWSYCTKCRAGMQDIILATRTHSKCIQLGCFKLWYYLYPSSISFAWMDMNGSMVKFGTKCTCYVQLDFHNKVMGAAQEERWTKWSTHHA